jgi:uncharacterized protein YjdB
MSFQITATTKAKIENISTKQSMKFQFNPETFTYGRTTTFNETSSPASPYPLISYGKGDMTIITMTVPMYNPNQQIDHITEFIDFLDEFLPLKNTSGFIDADPKPRELMLFYGMFSRKCVLKSVSTEYIRYYTDGMPRQANITLEFIELGEIFEYGQTTRPTITVPKTPDNLEQDPEEGNDLYDPVDPSLPLAEGFTLVGQAHVQNIGDMTEDEIQALEDRSSLIVDAEDQPSEVLKTLAVDSSQWLQIGTTGQSLRLESLRLYFKATPANIGIAYRVHCENLGWLTNTGDSSGASAFSNGEWAGTTGQGLRLEAVKIWLTGTDADKYDVQYQAHVQNKDWQDWKENGRVAGTVGAGLRLEALRVRIITKQKHPYGDIGIAYRAHVQNLSWYQNDNANRIGFTYDNDYVGTIDESLRLEALQMYIYEFDGYDDLQLEVQAHVENYGDMPAVTFGDFESISVPNVFPLVAGDDVFVGTVGEGLRLEAVSIKLVGTDAWRFNVYYVAYVQNIGFMDYVSNGAWAGTRGLNLRMEGIRVIIHAKELEVDTAELLETAIEEGRS